MRSRTNEELLLVICVDQLYWIIQKPLNVLMKCQTLFMSDDVWMPRNTKRGLGVACDVLETKEVIWTNTAGEEAGVLQLNLFLKKQHCSQYGCPCLSPATGRGWEKDYQRLRPWFVLCLNDLFGFYSATCFCKIYWNIFYPRWVGFGFNSSEFIKQHTYRQKCTQVSLPSG